VTARLRWLVWSAVLGSASLLYPAQQARAQAAPERIVEWVEEAPADDNSKIALGYPLPVPVDTPLPFDGFRSYAGLHMRHQDLALTTPWVQPVEVGTTQQGRPIWLYRLGDADLETAYGFPEHAMLTNGGIHAREWQSPEVATGIIELLALGDDDRHLLSYLRENANMLVIPVHNVDGFLQTQRYPGTNWLGTDPNHPEYFAARRAHAPQEHARRGRIARDPGRSPAGHRPEPQQPAVLGDQPQPLLLRPGQPGVPRRQPAFGSRKPRRSRRPRSSARPASSACTRTCTPSPRCTSGCATTITACPG
jgi:hypothetical protein